MSGKVYDLAHRLAKEIRKSDEYREYRTIRTDIEDDEKAVKMLRDFREKQMKIQSARFSGEEIDEREEELARRLQELVQSSPRLREYLEKEGRLFTMYRDILEIIGDSVDFD